MSRAVPEWIGKTDDTTAPKRVQVRVFERQGGKCAITGVKLVPGTAKELDHIIALANGGENRESNLQWITAKIHKAKTARDVATKSKIARVKSKHLDMHRPKSVIPGSRNSPLKRKVNGMTVWRDDE